MIQTISFNLGGKDLSIETGRVAKQANGSVLVGMGDTIILATAVMSHEPREGLDFFPLTCDYEERRYAVGKIPGGFNKRGGRPSEKAILVSRLMDRPIRPLFPKGLRHDVQCIAMPIAVDQNYPPDVLAVNAVSAALMISDIPWNGPIGAVRIGKSNGSFVLFPNVQEVEEGELDLILAGTKEKIIMVECGAKEVKESEIIEAMEFGHQYIKTICEELEKFREIAGKEKRAVTLFEIEPEVIETIRRESGEEIREAIQNPDKTVRESALSDLLRELVQRYSTTIYADDPQKQLQLPEAIDKVIQENVRELVLKKKLRPDGRGPRDIRPITIEPGLLPKVHGSGLFTRGQTQVLSVVTLGTPDQAQILDGLEEIDRKSFMHFYNFPPYSVGEVRPMRGPGRREIGHGALAERALKTVLPPSEEFPYTTMVVSEVLESNGSTSMASVCSSSVALLDCGVSIKAPVAGIAMGLMTDGEQYITLTDIQGMEDFCGDMDFKVAGTREGITAMQLDCKIAGIPISILKEALEQAREARFYILDKIDEAVPERRKELNPNAPRLVVIQINPNKIGEVIGPSGKVIKRIIAETDTEIDVEQDGRVYILGKDTAAIESAKRMIEGLVKVPEIGDEYVGPVTRLMSKGVMVEFLPGREGMVPIEHLSSRPIRRAEEVVKVGDILRVKVLEVDSLGRVNLTALGLPQEVETLKENVEADASAVVRSRDKGYERGERPRHPRDGYGRTRRGEREQESRREEQRPQFRRRSSEEEHPRRERDSESGTSARFRPKR
ncbi:MAG TPA: polyribonucleotide nucleotidyltransferase [Fimbriimonadales bacterium]|nr:polyribonucleotide nucleotidyltransferase [Fimbriimonadales bacterium]